jgi:DNA-binding IclR family transcriptional regulator
MAIDENKLGEFMNKIVGDVGAAMSGALVLLGDRLGLYKAMAALGPSTPAELAARTETTERYVHEWLNAQAAGGYVTYDPANGRYTLPPEQAFALADEQSQSSPPVSSR